VDGPDSADYVSTAGYREALLRTGWQKLTEKSAPAALLVTIPEDFPLQPGVDLALGDLVDLSFPALGVEDSLRLTATTMTAEAGRVNWICRFSPDAVYDPDPEV